MAKIKIDSNLFDRVKQAAEAGGYSSAEEFVVHIIISSKHAQKE